MTDTLNSYSNNQLSYFEIVFTQNDDSWAIMEGYIKFDHKFETDTLIDGGFISVSHDSGKTFINIIDEPVVHLDNIYF